MKKWRFASKIVFIGRNMFYLIVINHYIILNAVNFTISSVNLQFALWNWRWIQIGNFSSHVFQYHNNRSVVVLVYNTRIVNHCKLVRRHYLSVRIRVSRYRLGVYVNIAFERRLRASNIACFSSGRTIMFGRDLRRWKACNKVNLFPGAFCLLWLLLLLLWLLFGIKVKFCSLPIAGCICKLTQCTTVDVNSFDRFHPVHYIIHWGSPVLFKKKKLVLLNCWSNLISYY